MKPEVNINYFINNNLEINQKLKSLEAKSKKYMLLRLVVFLLFIGVLIYSLIKQQNILIIISVLLLIIFFIIVSYHYELENEIYFMNYKKEVNLEYIARINCDFNKLEDSGEDLFKNIQEPYLEDLDLYGDRSLFKLISICKTKSSRKKLKECFINKNNDLKNTQEAISELEDKREFCIIFQAFLKKFKKSVDKNDVSSENNDQQRKIPIIYICIGILLLVFFIISFILFIINDKYVVTLLSLLFIQVIYGNIVYFLCVDVFSFLDKVNYAYYPLNDIYKIISNEKFNSKILKEEQKSIQEDYIFLTKFNRISFLNALRKNFISNILGNILSLNIFIAIFNNVITKDKKDNEKGFLNQSLTAFEKFQVYVSLSIFNVVKENKCVPNLVEKNALVLEFKNLKHPLIPEEKCVGNSFCLKNSVNIITGSNMSGKTSFLRVIGMNLILMNLGCKVNGENFEASSFNIFTSMRIKDDFIHGISSFYSELLNIKKAIDFQKTEQNMICFIDEIFRGTNSNDRISGAISLIKQLNKKNVVLFLTTHDFELCDIKISNIDNFHFEEHYENNKILFDYKIKNGKCTTTNAKYLMKMVGIEE